MLDSLPRAGKGNDHFLFSFIMLHQLVRHWHRLLRMPVHPPSWYRARLHGELHERSAARRGTLHHLSETADVLYALTRAALDRPG
ncbi:hypothetical protein JKP88DRAFT_282984 [Tribonema minus]|uniref:Uncharacterized protein n=1 Tax=Tribonema minus TaxID=303371 RepID=A0A836C8V8_9STRA|nr:hypothetical protein JKP88DRAFT_282984 [Tribonema minus]